MTSVRVVLRAATAALTEAGADAPARDSRLLLAAALGRDVSWLAVSPDAEVPADAAVSFDALVRRRAAREPLAQILGSKEFYGRPFRVSRAVLTPRPDSETVVDAVLALVADRDAPLRLCDLGTGSGCLALTLLAELPQARAVAVDRSAEALAVAAENAAALGVSARVDFRQGDWLAGVGGLFDVIVANPPYIPSADLDALTPEVRAFEPALALDGGSDGLDSYRAILSQAPAHLAPGGFAVLELGAGQEATVRALAQAAGLEINAVRADLGSIPRALCARKPCSTMGEKQLGKAGGFG